MHWAAATCPWSREGRVEEWVPSRLFIADVEYAAGWFDCHINRRRHSSWGNVPPVEHEQALLHVDNTASTRQARPPMAMRAAGVWSPNGDAVGRILTVDLALCLPD